MKRRTQKLQATIPLAGALVAFGICVLMSFSAQAAVPTDVEAIEPGVALWTITQGWDEEAEGEYSRWVEQLGRVRGERGCLRLQSCLENPEANSLWTDGEKWPRLFADCADLPYVLRAYFSYKTGRPFQFTNRIYGRRYGKTTRVKSYADFTNRKFRSVRSMFSHMTAWIHSGFFRTEPSLEGTDTFPIEVTREHIRPGTMFYEPRGHVLVVVRVEPNGTIHMFDGHPDNSLTYKRFSTKIKRGGVRSGGGFRNWRWIHYRNDPVVGMLWERETNAEILASGRGFDPVSQYQKHYTVDGNPSTYHGWVRSRLRLPMTVRAVLDSVQRVFHSRS